jgi:hypothetical protein
MRLALMIGLLAYGVSSQEFTLATPKGDVLVKVTQNNFTLGQSFHMIGAITNTTKWDLDCGFRAMPISVPN